MVREPFEEMPDPAGPRLTTVHRYAREEGAKPYEVGEGVRASSGLWRTVVEAETQVLDGTKVYVAYTRAATREERLRFEAKSPSPYPTIGLQDL